MKLFLTAKSERGKPITKSGNEEINITLTNERRQKFDIKFTGESIEVMRYSDATIDIIPYIPCDLCGWGGFRKCVRCSKKQ